MTQIPPSRNGVNKSMSDWVIVPCLLGLGGYSWVNWWIKAPSFSRLEADWKGWESCRRSPVGVCSSSSTWGEQRGQEGREGAANVGRVGELFLPPCS